MNKHKTKVEERKRNKGKKKRKKGPQPDSNGKSSNNKRNWASGSLTSGSVQVPVFFKQLVLLHSLYF